MKPLTPGKYYKILRNPLTGGDQYNEWPLQKNKIFGDYFLDEDDDIVFLRRNDTFLLLEEYDYEDLKSLGLRKLQIFFKRMIGYIEIPNNCLLDILEDEAK